MKRKRNFEKEINERKRSKRRKLRYDFQIVYNFDVKFNKESKEVLSFNDFFKKIKPTFKKEHLLIELIRSKFLTELRKLHKNLIKQSLDLNPPRESMNRWLMERNLFHQPFNEKHDPVLPSAEDIPLVSPLLYREIEEDIPVKVSLFPRFQLEIHTNINLYIRKTESFLSRFKEKLNKGEVEIIRKELGNLTNFINSFSDFKTMRKKYSDLIEKTKKVISPILVKVISKKIEKVCEDLNRKSIEYSKILFKKRNSFSKSELRGIKIRVNDEKTQYRVCLKGETGYFLVTNFHYKKLLNLYRGDKLHDLEEFHQQLWLLLCRYEFFFGNPEKNLKTSSFEGSGHQEFNVTMECFASPFNCYFRNYCSAFLDTDHDFGSIGSFFNFHPLEGSFEANPPFVEELLIKMVDHMESLCENADKKKKAISFCIILPNWTDATSLTNLLKSKYCRNNFLLERREHTYVNGFQHRAKIENEFYKAVHQTRIIFLQSKEGNEKWKPNEIKLNKIKEAFN